MARSRTRWLLLLLTGSLTVWIVTACGSSGSSDGSSGGDAIVTLKGAAQ